MQIVSNINADIIGVMIVVGVGPALMVLLFHLKRFPLLGWVNSFIHLSYVHVLVVVIRVGMLGLKAKGLLFKSVGTTNNTKSK